ncbi:hypothetical protein Taro_032032 [Colocasia esculenta]|uniref:Uncharacterized protein n=1 Tax=Colocasia esculenta TaxID=4460 RepID=A0A843W0P0_COLES|nr:hypothetical protein [Colocasia esculenta]
MCIIQPPHLRGKFSFPKYISTAAKPVLPEKTTVYVNAWDQDLFVESGLHLICDDVFEISPSLTAINDLQDFTRHQCNYDMIWCDLDTHITCRLQLFKRHIGLDTPTSHVTKDEEDREEENFEFLCVSPKMEFMLGCEAPG